MMIIKQNMALIILIFSLFSSMALPQNTNLLEKKDTEKTINPAVQTIFSEIENAFSSGNVSALSAYLGPQTYFSLSNGINGYYSTSQAFYVLEDFFKIYKVVIFKFNNIQAGGNNPYATGEYVFELKGKRETAKVYISLKPAGSSWKITQITIN
ncbi:MAG: DUF4783 domain-containing protein [Ignavibacteriaceae bacterium]|nr:DUF4783 domain-containing protein [Ignavibacteriaceae bacterium]